MTVIPTQTPVGSTVPTLTLAAGTTGGVAVASTIDPVNDYLAIYTASATATQGINRNTLLGLTSAPLGLTDTQSPTNKTFNNTNTYTALDSGLTVQNASDNTKQFVFSASGITTGNKRTYTMPDYNATLATLAGTETLTNKTLTTPTINGPTITNANITVDAIVGYTTSNSGTLYGISVTTGAISSALSLTSTLSVSSTTTLTGQLTVQGGTAPPSAGSTSAGIKLSSTANFGVFFGSGVPTFSAAQGSVYLRTDGSSTSTRLYVNTNGSTGWTSFTSAA